MAMYFERKSSGAKHNGVTNIGPAAAGISGRHEDSLRGTVVDVVEAKAIGFEEVLDLVAQNTI